MHVFYILVQSLFSHKKIKQFGDCFKIPFCTGPHGAAKINFATRIENYA